MDATLKGVIDLIGSADVEVRCAALLVLTHLAAGDERAVRAVGEALGGRNAVVRDFAVGYFERVRPRDGVGYLVPLLDSPEDALRQRAVEILAPYGQAAVGAAKKLVKDAPRRRLNAVIDLCARVRTAAALDLLFDLMAGNDFDTNRAACDAVSGVVPGLDARARTELLARTEALAAGAKGHRTALVAAAKLFGALADAKARRRLFGMLDKQEPQVVRTHALGALVQCLRGAKLTAAEIDALLPLLESDDEVGVLRPVIHLLDGQTLERSYLAQLNRLADSAQPLVKRFAVQKLGGVDSGAVVKTLIGYLTDDSYARRDQAITSLKKLPAARSALMKELLDCEDERRAWTVADILLAHDRDWKRDTRDALGKKLEAALEQREDRLYTAYFHFLNALDAEALATRVCARADALRKKKDFASAARWLALLKDSPAFDVDARFALAVSELKAHRHALSAVVRRHDPAFDQLRELLRSPFPLGERLRKERVLTPEELFYIAFNFAEGGGEEKGLARELLEHVAAKSSRTKVGKAAKNKLRLLPAAG